MSDFIQLHLLVSYPPSNLNRDDLGRPKTAIVGGTQRLRVSSQSLKRAWRQSSFFTEALAGHMGVRTKEMGVLIEKSLVSGVHLMDLVADSNTATAVRNPISDKDARAAAILIAGQFGKCKKEDKKDIPEVEQLVHFSPEEILAIDTLLEEVALTGKSLADSDLRLLRKNHTAVDIAMFGRMLASAPEFNTEAAVQVAHAITVHATPVEDDYFTAVDDLNRGIEDMGAGHIGEFEFGSGLFYLYVCIDRELLASHLQGDEVLTDKAVCALCEATVKVSPGGKQNSFASRAYASYLLAERGNEQPRSLSVAFLKGVAGSDLLSSSIEQLEQTRDQIDAVYGTTFGSSCRSINVSCGSGTFSDIQSFVSGSYD